MPNQQVFSTENNFTKGLITEFTGLNFPENAAIDTDNCEYTLVGDVVRRLGINEEVNGTIIAISTALQATNQYVWNNPGGDGNSKLLAKQIGSIVYFYNIAASTASTPLSANLLAGQVNLTTNTVVGQTFDATKECQFADGNGYLFVYHSTCEPIYVTYNATTKAIAFASIPVQVRDFNGLLDGLQPNTRPSALSLQHQYNLQNQGWTSGAAWSATSTDTKLVSTITGLGSITWTVPAGIAGISNGQTCVVYGTQTLGNTAFYIAGSATVTSYSGTSLTLHVTSTQGNAPSTFNLSSWTITLTSNSGYISTWFAAEGNYPSNADVWWTFKNTSDVFDPTTVQPNTPLSIGRAPQGHYVFNAFNQDRVTASTIQGLPLITTLNRPTTGAWFAGRVWFTGVSAFQDQTSSTNFYTWTENIYFSQVAQDISVFGNCYQVDDPTSDGLNSILPTDGGVITIPGTGTIHKLWPVANGMLVFANNGVWYITGSQGIGFAANDYTITKISAIQVLSSKSFIDVMGLPFFWNEEGIYQVQSGQGGQLAVEPITVGTILSYYNSIPLASKKYARGAYDPINYRIQWIFKSTQETDVTSRYQFDTILNYNTYNKAFYPYSVSASVNNNFINGISYVNYPYIATATPEPSFKYGMVTSPGGTSFVSFADENDEAFVDWGSVDYESFFVTGYKVHGGGLKKFQVPYVNVFSRNIADYVAYYIQGFWDYPINSNSGGVSTKIFSEKYDPNHSVSFKRHKIRGRGYTLQFKVSSVSGVPFDIIGWATYENLNAGV